MRYLREPCLIFRYEKAQNRIKKNTEIREQTNAEIRDIQVVNHV